MKYIKLLWFDIRNGTLKKPAFWIAPAVIAAVAFADLTNRVRSLNAVRYFGAGLRPSFADYIFYVYGGMRRHISDPINPFIFPVQWLIVFLTIAFFALNYPYQDMQTFGQQILIRTKGRTLWWLSKCGWNILSSLVYHGVIYLAVLACCVAAYAQVPGDIHINLVHAVFAMDKSDWVPRITRLPFSVLLLPPLVSLGINMWQMALSLFVKPIFSFFAVSLLMVSSAYFLSPHWIGNYAMPVRYGTITLHGVGASYGIWISVALIVASVLVGAVRFRYYDILNRE